MCEVVSRLVYHVGEYLWTRTILNTAQIQPRNITKTLEFRFIDCGNALEVSVQYCALPPAWHTIPGGEIPLV